MYSDWVARNPGKSDKQVVNVEWVLKVLDKLIPPVGSIYMSTSAVNPSSIYPGTSWVAWGSGRVPIGVNSSDTAFNSVEKTGGAKTHTLTVSEMPSHNHSITDTGHLHKFYDRWTDGQMVQSVLRMTRLEWLNVILKIPILQQILQESLSKIVVIAKVITTCNHT